MRPDVPVLRRADYFIADVSQVLTLELVREHHYAKGGSRTAVYRHGLFHVDDPETCLGVAQWLPPTKVAAQTVHPDWRRVLSLTRLVVVPGVPQNAATYLMAASIRRIRKEGRFAALVTYADEGQGHTGAIYRAANWTEVPALRGAPVWRDASGRHVSKKMGPRSRSSAEMVALGYIRSPSTRKRKFVMVLEQPAGLAA